MATTDNKEPLKRFWKLVNLEKGEHSLFIFMLFKRFDLFEFAARGASNH